MARHVKGLFEVPDFDDGHAKSCVSPELIKT